ncbi:unnamed protein product [Dracunculus medinensis]|uniref:PRELI/MSF1 domain-containing protein n=1 Tax=Dracunculus medinensis TaxID=318479 RepID=A0A0N4UJY1_DRAME|nr:unnamed protein product [Dracunculus medinensis]
MRFWDSPSQDLPYSFEEVASIFWNRYPNSKAQHVISEDVLERKVIGDQIRTKKLIVKKGASFLKAAPRWLTKLNNIQVIVPTLEESIFDRKTRSLTTYTRNISWVSFFNIHEKCIYRPVIFDSQTSLQRSLYVSVLHGRISAIIERVVLMSFRKSVKKTVAGLLEKLEESIFKSLSSKNVSQKAAAIKDKLMSNKNISFEKV